MVPVDADATTMRTAETLVDGLDRIVGEAELVTLETVQDDAVADLGASVAIVLEGERNHERFDDARLEALGPSGFAIEHELRGDRALVWTAANTRLSRQYAAYEVLRRLGTRFFHPEQEYVLELTPEQLRQRIVVPTILQPGGADAIPDFAWRSWSFHSAHPLEHLEASAEAHAGWATRMTELGGSVPPAASPWLEEIIDGLAIVGARARHTAALYRAVLAYADGDEVAAADAWARAEAALEDAATIVARREAAYRYPAAQTFGGGLTPETAVPNGTTYPYRVHTKTHLLTYWRNRHDEVATILEGGLPTDSGRVSIRDALADLGEPLDVTWPDLDALEGEVSFGALGTLQPPAGMLDTGTAPGVFPVDGLLVAEDRELPVAGYVARTSVLARTPRDGLTLTEPAAPTAQAVLSSVFPAIEWGMVAASGQLVIAVDDDDDGVVEHDATFVTDVVVAAGQFTATPITLEIPVALGSGGLPVAVTLRAAVFSGASNSDGFGDAIDAEGEIEIDDLVRALVELAGFDEQGALDTLASLLGFDAASPPATVPFAARFALTGG